MPVTAARQFSHAIRVLVVDDDEDDYVLARDTLNAIPAASFETAWVDTYDRGLSDLTSNLYDLCLLDFHLGAMSGLDLLREATRLGSKTPVIVLTGQGSYQIDLQAMREGALFYLDKKSLQPSELERSVRYSLERAHLLQTMREANEELELRVAERTRQLTTMNIQLERALAQEHELNMLRSRLVTTMSHEFRTPLAVILSSSELLRRYGDRMSEEQKNDRLDEVINQVHWMTRLLSDMFTFRKVNSDSLPTTFEETDLVAFCQSLLDELRPNLGFGQHLALVVKGRPAIAFLDLALLQHIVSNLVDNSIKYSPNGGAIVLTLAFERDTATLEVSDQGIGILEADQPHLFEPFVRGENAHIVKGAGLGLAIVNHAVDVLGGTIELRSEPGVGTTVRVRLPLMPTA